MSNFWDILHCMDFLMSEHTWTISRTLLEVGSYQGANDSHVAAADDSTMTFLEQWLGPPSKGAKRAKTVWRKSGGNNWGSQADPVDPGSGIPLSTSLPLGSGDSPFQVLSEVIDLFCHERSCHNITRTKICLELGVFALQIVEPCCVTVNLLATSQKNGGLPICFSRGWCRTIIGCDRLQGDAVGELNNFITILGENEQKSHPRLCFHVLVRLEVPGIVFVFRLAVLFCSWKIGVVRKRLLPTPLWMFPAKIWNQHYIS